MLILCLIISQMAILCSGIAFFTLSVREKRFPSLIFMIELMGRWGQILTERRDPWVSTAVVGFLIAAVGMIACVALGLSST